MTAAVNFCSIWFWENYFEEDTCPPRNETFRRRRFGDGRFGDEMWNVFSFGMSPKCKSSHCRREACRRKIRSSTGVSNTRPL